MTDSLLGPDESQELSVGGPKRRAIVLGLKFSPKFSRETDRPSLLSELLNDGESDPLRGHDHAGR